MPTQNNNTKNDQILQILQKLEKLEHGQTILYYLLAGFLAFLLFVAGLMFFTWGDAKKLQSDVDVLQTQHATQHP